MLTFKLAQYFRGEFRQPVKRNVIRHPRSDVRLVPFTLVVWVQSWLVMNHPRGVIILWALPIVLGLLGVVLWRGVPHYGALLGVLAVVMLAQGFHAAAEFSPDSGPHCTVNGTPSHSKNARGHTLCGTATVTKDPIQLADGAVLVQLQPAGNVLRDRKGALVTTSSVGFIVRNSSELRHGAKHSGGGSSKAGTAILAALPQRGSTVRFQVLSYQAKGQTYYRLCGGLEVVAKPSTLARVANSVRDRFHGVLGHAPEHTAQLLPALVLGDERWLVSQMRHDFLTAGLLHSMVFSGANFVIMLKYLSLLTAFTRLKPAVQLGINLVGIAFITLMVGAQGAVVRAAIMGACACLSTNTTRVKVPLGVVSFACIAILVWSPATSRDAGFMLSVCATVGIIVASGPLRKGAVRCGDYLVEKLVQPRYPRLAGVMTVGMLGVSELFAVSTAATLAVTPCLGVISRMPSVMDVVANVCGEPIIALIVPVGTLLVIIAIVHINWLVTIIVAVISFPIDMLLALISVVNKINDSEVVMEFAHFPAIILAAIIAVFWLRGRLVSRFARIRGSDR